MMMTRTARSIGFLLLSGTLSISPALAEETKIRETSGALGKVAELPTGLLSKSELKALIAIGEDLFAAKFTADEGAGRPAATQAIIPTKKRRKGGASFARIAGSDANACSSCHNDPLLGGAGDFATNVFVSEGFNNTDFDTTDPQFSNERGTNHLFGAGLIELLAREISTDLSAIRTKALSAAGKSGKSKRLQLISKGISYGFITAHADGLVDLSEIDGIDDDLVVRPFSQKGVITSLRQFTVNASNMHHGIQPTERYGARWTGDNDHDEDGFADEMQAGDVSALVAWQATLPAPIVKTSGTGKAVFDKLQCSTCHIEALPLNSLTFHDPGPFDVTGTLNTLDVKASAQYDMSLLDWSKQLPRNDAGQIMVPLFGDLKRHKMTDSANDQLGNELLSQRFVERNIFMTTELWGVGSTAPYGHRNDFTTLNSIILAHGGAAKSSRDAYAKAPVKDRQALIDWLKTLVIAQ